MENRGVLIGSIIFVFASFILMIVGLVYESYRAKQQRLLVESIVIESKPVATVAPRDYSLYKTIVGDDGREMVQIPEGPFTMGSKDGDPDEAPEHQVYLSTYYMDKKEVTQAEYERFVKMTKRGKPFIPVFEDDQAKILKPELPAMGMSWADAEAYCKWAGKRLPTEAEWEKAGRGEGKRRYPWVMTSAPATPMWTATRMGLSTCPRQGRSSLGESLYGLYDMTGNVAEWVADNIQRAVLSKDALSGPLGPEDGQHKVIRGGSWRETHHNARLSKRFQAKMWRTDTTIGIRCAKDADEPSAEARKSKG